MSRSNFTSQTAGLVLLLGSCAPAWCPADAPAPPEAEPGFRNVAIKEGGKTAYIQVKDAGDPYKNVKDSGDNTPDHFSFNQTSPMANMRYDTANTAASHDTGSYQKNLEHTFITKSYFANGADNADKLTAGLHTAVAVNSAEGFSNRASGFDKSFLTASAEVGQNKAADDSSLTSSYQGQSAVLGGHDIKTFASSMGSKTFQGREADAVKRDLNQMNEGLLGIKDLPNRALTIDEVRALINHGVKPEMDGKPAEPSKPLNDPGYMPDPAPAPLRDSPADAHHLTDENDVVPPPGTMAHPQGMSPPPEDTQPLPQ